ncbi:MAG: MSCRAMM family protein, partial [Planctomycetota bacterium]
DLELKLPPAPRLRVHVVDAEGQPVPRAMVYLEAPGSGDAAANLQLLELGYVEMVSDVSLGGFSGFSGMPGSQQETDEDGWARFPALSSGDFELTVRASGFTDHTEPLSLGLGDEEVEVALSRGATLRLTLTDESGDPVGDLPVTLKNAASGKELQSIHTDALGRAVWADLEAGLYQIAYRANEADGYWWGRNDDEEVAHDQPVVDIEAGEIKEETLVVRDLALVTVVVRRGGLAAAGVGVRLQEIQDQEMHWYGSNEPGKPTDGRGKVVLNPVQAGRYKVIVKGSLDTPPLEQEVELHGGPQRIEVDLNGARIEGKLRGSDNAPLVGARVALVPYVEEIAEDGSTRPRRPNMVMNWSSRGLEFTDYAEMMTSTKTDGFGGFAFRDVPEGRWQVVARAEGHGPWHSQPRQVLGSTTVDVGDHRLAAMAVIEGRDMNWTPNPQAQQNGYFDWNNSVRLERADDGMNLSMAQIDETGHYRLVDLAAGTYRLRKGQYRSDPFTLREGEMMRHDIPLEVPDEDE